MNKGFKVVAVMADVYWSAVKVNGVEYQVGVMTFPRKGNGPLCVFDTLEQAVNFSEGFSSKTMRIFECEYKLSDQRTVWSAGEASPMYALPKGTRLADWVKLTKEVGE